MQNPINPSSISQNFSSGLVCRRTVNIKGRDNLIIPVHADHPHLLERLMPINFRRYDPLLWKLSSNCHAVIAH